MNTMSKSIVISLFFVFQCLLSFGEPLSIKGVSVIPHVQSPEMKYRKETNFSLGARVQIFLQNSSGGTRIMDASTDIRLRGKTPNELITNDKWSWHDFPSAYAENSLSLPPDTLTVWSWNGNYEEWGVDESVNITIPDMLDTEIRIETPQIYLSAITFLSSENSPFPDTMIFHIANDSESDISIESYRLWLPKTNKTWRTLYPQSWNKDFSFFPDDGTIPSNDKGAAIVATELLPLTYAALEVRIRDRQGIAKSIWGYLRIKREVFDISGGWVSSNIDGQKSLTYEPYLKVLKRMHINTGHIADTSGYTDNPALYSKYPLKYFNKLDNFDQYDSDEILPRIHAVEFLGEPQYGGGKPVAPMEVWKAFLPYQATRLPTTVTHSEERIWRFYSGLSDYPHFDAYRVTAPAADNWRLYDRWGEKRIRWGAPLETIGVMTRSLRDLNRPMPIAYWSQGAHDGWGRSGGRERTSPTPVELRSQAYHALAARITSLYWFNLSFKSLKKFPDLIDPITEIDREIKTLEDYYLLGDAYHYERVVLNQTPQWDLSVIAAPQGALLFALDLNYEANDDEKVFQFQNSRKAELEFPLPEYLRNPIQALQVDAHKIINVPFETTRNGVRLKQSFGPVDIFVVTHDLKLMETLESKRQSLVKYEESFELERENLFNK